MSSFERDSLEGEMDLDEISIAGSDSLKYNEEQLLATDENSSGAEKCEIQNKLSKEERAKIKKRKYKKHRSQQRAARVASKATNAEKKLLADGRSKKRQRQSISPKNSQNSPKKKSLDFNDHKGGPVENLYKFGVPINQKPSNGTPVKFNYFTKRRSLESFITTTNQLEGRKDAAIDCNRSLDGLPLNTCETAASLPGPSKEPIKDLREKIEARKANNKSGSLKPDLVPVSQSLLRTEVKVNKQVFPNKKGKGKPHVSVQERLHRETPKENQGPKQTSQGIPSKKQKISYADTLKSDLTIYLKKKNGRSLSETEYEEICRFVKMEQKNVVGDGYPIFNRVLFNGIMATFNCADEFSMNWLLSMIPKIIDGLKIGKLVPISAKDLLRLRKAVFSLPWDPKQPVEPEEVFLGLRRANRGLDTKLWILKKRIDVKDNASLKIYSLRIDEASAKWIESHGCVLYYQLGTVKVKLTKTSYDNINESD